MSKETLRRYSIRGANRTEPLASLELDDNQFVVRDRGLAVAALPLSERTQAMTVYESLVNRLMEFRQVKSPPGLDLLAIEES